MNQSNMTDTPTKTPRIEVVDALRGFAVLAILLVHSVEHFIFPVYPDPSADPQWLTVVDQGVKTIIFGLFAGKAYAIFALLFGLTFYIQYTNQQKKNKDFGYRFLWRMVLLTGFATLNAAFFPAGDVLLLFSIVGIILFIIRRWKNRSIFILACILLFQPMEWMHYMMSLLNPDYKLPDLGVTAMYETIANCTQEGNFVQFIKENITLGQKASLFWAIGAGRVFQTAGLFLLGCLIGRKKLFIYSEDNINFWTKALIFSSILFLPLYLINTDIMTQASEIIQQTAGVAFDMWQKLAFTIVLIASFFLLYQQTSFQKLTTNLRFYGRMSLSNYVMQSVFGALIYFPIGLYLAPYCGYALSLIIGFAIFLIQIMFCKWWLSTHPQGPLETIWHKLTWLGK